MSKRYKLFLGDCLEVMKQIPDKKVDCIICDLPYGTTACKWDIIIPFEPLWEQYKRVIKDRGAVVLFGSEPFSSYLRMSNIKGYKYDWIWVKSKSQGFLNAKRRPLKNVEIISVFNSRIYFPQGLIEGKFNNFRKSKISKEEDVYGTEKEFGISKFSNYPKTTLFFKGETKVLHPTQKPVALLEYLIKTYTLENEIVLDNCMGSGSTGVACMNLNRKFIGIEKEEKYFNIAKERIEKAEKKYNDSKHS